MSYKELPGKWGRSETLIVRVQHGQNNIWQELDTEGNT